MIYDGGSWGWSTPPNYPWYEKSPWGTGGKQGYLAFSTDDCPAHQALFRPGFGTLLCPGGGLGWIWADVYVGI